MHYSKTRPQKDQSQVKVTSELQKIDGFKHQTFAFWHKLPTVCTTPKLDLRKTNYKLKTSELQKWHRFKHQFFILA